MGIGDGDWGWALGIWGGVGDMHGASGMGILMGIRDWGWALGMGSGNGEWGWALGMGMGFRNSKRIQVWVFGGQKLQEPRGVGLWGPE